MRQFPAEACAWSQVSFYLAHNSTTNSVKPTEAIAAFPLCLHRLRARGEASCCGSESEVSGQPSWRRCHHASTTDVKSPQYPWHRSLADMQTQRDGEERRGHGEAESVFWRIMLCARRRELTRCLNNYISHYVKMKESVLPFSVCLVEENIF